MALVELEQRTEEAYRTRRESLTLRRAPAPALERLVDVRFEILMSGEDDVAFRLLHTADWHLGKRFPSFDESAEKNLRRARLDVLAEVFAAATRSVVDAVLCAGDLFDEPNPSPDWWRGLQEILRRLPSTFPPVFLLPGNHDPLLPDSVWMTGHPFRAGLPGFVRVVDRDDFREEIKPGLVLHAVPCSSKAGAGDPVEKIPPRAPGDESVRVGLVHGTTFDLPNCEMNFPIRSGGARARGLDYLAIGDTHGYRVVQEIPWSSTPGLLNRLRSTRSTLGTWSSSASRELAVAPSCGSFRWHAGDGVTKLSATWARCGRLPPRTCMRRSSDSRSISTSNYANATRSTASSTISPGTRPGMGARAS